MKKTLLVLAALLSIAACSPSGGDSSSQSEPSSSPSSPTSSSPASAKDIFVESGWPEKEAETLSSIFFDHLYPYYDFGKEGYTYELSTYEGSFSMVSAHLEIADFPFEQVKNYLSAMTNGTGFIDKTDDYGVPEGEYIIEKSFSDYSLISAAFYISDGEGSVLTEDKGTFELDIHPVKIAKEAFLGEDIEKFVAELLEKDISLPNPSSPAERYIATVEASRGTSIPSLYFIGADAREGYASDLATAGWKKVPLEGSEYDDLSYFISPDETISATISIINPSDPLISVIEFQKAEYFITYPETMVNECIDMIFLTTQHVSLPVPESEDITFYQVNDILEISGFFEIYIYGTDYSDAYEESLAKAGFHLVDYDMENKQFYYADSDEKMYIYTYYKAASETSPAFTDIVVGRNLYYYAGWPENVINRMTSAVGGETMLPADNEIDYVTVTPLTSGSEDFSFVCKDFDENMNLIDIRDRYKALLNASGSGWTHDEVEDRWHDEKGKLGVFLRFNEQVGLTIYVEQYTPSSKEIQESELASAFSSVGVDGYSFQTVDGANGYSLVDGAEGQFSIIAWGIDESALAAYQEKLANSGHSSRNVGGMPYYFDSSKKASFTMNYNELGESLTIVFQSYASRFNYSAANLETYISKVQEQYDSAFTLPKIPCKDDSEGVMRLYEEYGFVAFSIAIFEFGLLPDLRTALTEDGWVESETSENYFFKDGNTYLWTIYLYENIENGYTDIDISGKQ